MQNNINYPYISEYLCKLLPPRDGILARMEEYAYKNKVPIVCLEVANFILTITRMINARNILEIGTAIGYSALLLSDTLKEGGKLTTIEKNKNMADIALENIIKANKQDIINIIVGDANNILPQLTEKYDCIFIDAAKGQYINFLPQCIRLLNSGGILISDNILYKGMVATDELVVARKKTIVKKLRNYNETIMNHPELDSSIIPIGDGVAISYKRGKTNEKA